MSDFFPYAVLSQLAGYPLGLVDDDRYSKYAFHSYLLNTVGSNKNFIRRADARSLKNMKSIESFEWEGIGHIISGNEGIIEPIVQSIQKCFLEIPEEIEKLYDKAFEENNFPLIWRIYLALRSMLGYSDDKFVNQARCFVERFNEYFNDFMVDFLTKDIDDPTEKQRIREVLSKMKK
ncbi:MULTISPECIES: hypothetical protein [Flavobacterium]|uniref:hypothetical protein n=1 Tax=Flavobacterium TaxID=237 RepID=UPI00319F4477